jgi:3-polyprenyl-4-hydroxybenzoate decarboxylase
MVQSVMPPVPAFSALPKSIDEMVNHTVGRCLDLFGIDTKLTESMARNW